MHRHAARAPHRGSAVLARRALPRLRLVARAAERRSCGSRRSRSGKVHDVTSPLRVDRSPAWDPDGKYLYFISTRDFNPVYDALQFDLSFPQAIRPFVVTLRADVPSPFVPKPKPVHRDHEREHERLRAQATASRRTSTSTSTASPGRVLGVPGRRGRVRPDRRGARARALHDAFPLKGIKPAGREDGRRRARHALAYDFDQQRLATIADRVRRDSPRPTTLAR